MLARRLSCIIAAAVLLSGAPLPVFAHRCAPDDASGGCSEDAGHVSGRVVSVDYQRGELTMLDGQAHRYHVHISPSTPVGSGDRDADEYHAFSDVSVGSRIDIEASRRGREYDAQSIEIQGR